MKRNGKARKKTRTETLARNGGCGARNAASRKINDANGGVVGDEGRAMAGLAGKRA